MKRDVAITLWSNSSYTKYDYHWRHRVTQRGALIGDLKNTVTRLRLSRNLYKIHLWQG